MCECGVGGMSGDVWVWCGRYECMCGCGVGGMSACVGVVWEV